MTTEQLEQNHPGIYQAIFNAGIRKGVEMERNRIQNWMVHIDQNKSEVVAGIKSGKELENTEFEETALANSIKEHLSSM